MMNNKEIRTMTDTHLKREIQSLSELADAMETGMIEAAAEDLTLINEKIDNYKQLRELNIKLALSQAGVPLEIMMSPRDKRIFFKLFNIFLWFRKLRFWK